MDWQEELKKKTISPEEAANLIKPGDLVVIPTGREPAGICYALAARKEELKGKKVRIFPGLAGRDFGWYDPGWEDSFSLEAGYIMPIMVPGMAERRFEFIVGDIMWNSYFHLEKHIDVLLLTLSPPDEHGYCSFGGSIWFKKKEIEYSKLVLAEMYPPQIRTYGRNFVHMSQIDYFTEHVSTGAMPKTRDMLGRTVSGPGEAEKKIAKNLSALIKDGDTIQIGAGGVTEFLPQLGAFDGKKDLGIHTEIIPGPLIRMVDRGDVFTGERKTIHPREAVGTAIGGGREEYAIVNQNPAFGLYEVDYTNDPRVIAANDNMVAINSAFAVDLYGQIAADSLGYRMLAGIGGQVAFGIGSQLSKGGHYVVVLTSRTDDQSRIVASFEPGTIVSMSRNLADYIVTDQGIASLRGKSERRRAEELIAIAHPDFREELRYQAKKLFWP